MPYSALLWLLTCLLCHSHGFHFASAEVICGQTEFFSISCPDGYKCCGQYGEHCCKDEAYLGKEYIENDIRRKIDEKRREEIARLKLKNNVTAKRDALEETEDYLRSGILFMQLLIFRSTEICCLVALIIIIGIACKHYIFGGIPEPYMFKRADDATTVTCYKLLPDQPIPTRIQRGDAAAASANTDPIESIWTTEIHENIHHQISEYQKWFRENENSVAMRT